MGKKNNSRRRGFGGHVGMERTDGAVNEKYISIGSFMERINIGLMSLVGRVFNELHGFTRYGTNHNFSDY